MQTLKEVKIWCITVHLLKLQMIDIRGIMYFHFIWGMLELDFEKSADLFLNDSQMEASWKETSL